MANEPALTTEQKEIEKQDKIRAFMDDLYGSEDVLIVRNTTNGVVSIGFGELGDKGGMPGGIPRTKLPIVLTDHFPREMWVKSHDFRRAIAKGWLVPVTKTDYDAEIRSQRQRTGALAQAAARDERPQVGHQPVTPNPFSDDPTREPQVLDEASASLKPASQDESLQRFMAYEGMETTPAPDANNPTGVNVIGGQVSSRALAYCNEQKRGSLTSKQALEWLDNEEKVLTEDDLTYICTNSEFDSVKSLARRFLADRS